MNRVLLLLMVWFCACSPENTEIFDLSSSVPHKYRNEKMEKEKALTDFDDPDLGGAWNSF